MTTEQAYRIIAKHIYIAYPTYSVDYEEIIVLADNESEARKKAESYFNRSLLSVHPLDSTNDPQIYLL